MRKLKPGRWEDIGLLTRRSPVELWRIAVQEASNSQRSSDPHSAASICPWPSLPSVHLLPSLCPLALVFYFREEWRRLWEPGFRNPIAVSTKGNSQVHCRNVTFCIGGNRKEYWGGEQRNCCISGMGNVAPHTIEREKAVRFALKFPPKRHSSCPRTQLILMEDKCSLPRSSCVTSRNVL